MSKYLIDSNTMENIASSIKQLSGNSGTLDGANLVSTLSSAAASKVDPPSGKITLTENATNVDVSQYATADINVSIEKKPVLLDNVVLENLPEQVNRITFSLGNYDLSNYLIIWVEATDLLLSASDWLYIVANNSMAYTLQAGRYTKFVKSCFNKTDSWRNTVKYYSPTSMSTEGDIIVEPDSIELYPYNSNNKFISGEVKLYAI